MEQGLRHVRLHAEHGDAEAQYGMGEMYRKGEGVSQSYQEAFRWYRKAADKGLCHAQSALGRCLCGQGRVTKQTGGG